MDVFYSTTDCFNQSESFQPEVSDPGSGQELPEEKGHLAEDQPIQQAITNPKDERSEAPDSDDLKIGGGFHNEKLQHWIDLGAAVCFLGRQNDLVPIPGAFWDRYRSAVDKATALDLVHAVAFLPEESIETALNGICILSDYRYGCKTSAGSVPALYVEFMIQYQSFYADNNYVSCSTGLYAFIMQGNGYGIAKLADSLGIGNDRAYKALNALKKDGLLLDADRINAPGAGRDNIDAVFAHDITPEVIAAGIKNEDIQFRKTLKELEEQTAIGGSKTETEGEKHNDGSTPSPEDGMPSEPKASCDGGPCSTGKASNGDSSQQQKADEGRADGQEGGEHYKTCETEEVDLSKLKADTLKAIKEAIEVIALALEGKKMDFELWKLMKRLEEDRKKVEDYYVLACPNEGDEAEGGMISINLVPAFVEFCDALRHRCDEIIQVKAQNEDSFVKGKDGDPEKIAYWRRKLLHKVIDRKRFLQGLDEEETRYNRICELLEEVKEYVAATEASAPTDGEESGQEPDAEAERAKRYEEGRAKALSDLEAVIKQIEAALEKTADHTQFYRKGKETLEFLQMLREDFTSAAQPELSENLDVSIIQEVMVSMLKIYMGDALELWAAYKKRRDALKHVADFLSMEKFTCWVARTFITYDKVFQDFQKSQEAQGLSGDRHQEAQEQDGEQDGEQDAEEAEAIRMAMQEALELALESLDTAISSFLTLIGMLRVSSDKQVLRKNSTANPIPEAIAYLEGMLERLAQLKTEAENTRSISVRKALSDMALSFIERNNAWTEILSEDCRYSIAKQVANSVNRQRYHDFCEKQAEMALESGEDKGWDPDVLGHYKEMHADDPLGLQSPEGYTISASERREIILALWERGMDPTSVKAWLQYITEMNSKEVFADPMGNVNCCKLTAEELSNSFRYLTGCKFSGRALWDYLKERMGFTRHQCVKEEQVGKPHPQKDAQYRYIDSLKESCLSNGKCLILSIDTKSAVKIGRYKYDNGLLLCSPDGKVYRVHDHDYVSTWEEAYGADNCPLDKSRLKERAIVHPCAVYDVLANTCHVSFVLGTENSESMANILIKAIQDKVKERPDIESVLILSDGGGVNSSNSFIWKNELLRAADETNLKLQVSHYPPGCSRHNPVERGVFAPLSRAWKGKSLHNLEVLAALTCATTTKKSKKGRPLKMTVLIDLAHYKTIKQKIADNDPVLTREEFEAKALNRIIHPHTEADGALFKWNYIVLPSSMVATEAC